MQNTQDRLSQRLNQWHNGKNICAQNFISNASSQTSSHEWQWKIQEGLFATNGYAKSVHAQHSLSKASQTP